MKAYLAGNKKNAYLLAGLLILVFSALSFSAYLFSSQRELKRMKSQHEEISLLKGEFASLKARLDEAERKKKLSKTSGIISAVEEIFSSMGLKSRIKSIKPVGSRDVPGSVEEDAEVSVEKLNMNETVNLFYRLENAPMLLVIKKVGIKTSFEKPELLNINLTISLVHEK